ncbi:hypothetical protein PANO111632_10890 [Paracoccus nototheniae]|uniref:Uncharacterized protein n=1 Tax=Paracoccus nototheniae TaxID=2489002 RepID=A0ABW4DU97_9RHOB|nr:hypothetical protein [Paracoccus nototheniae]
MTPAITPDPDALPRGVPAPAVMARRLAAMIAVLALVLMSAFLPARPIAVGGMQLPHDHVTDSALLSGQAVLVRPAATAPAPKAPDPVMVSAPLPAPMTGPCPSGVDHAAGPQPRVPTAARLPGRPRAPPVILA